MKSGTKIKFMTRIVLEISQEKDVALLLALLDRLNIQVVQKKSDIDKPGAALQEEQVFLLKGDGSMSAAFAMSTSASL